MRSRRGLNFLWVKFLMPVGLRLSSKAMCLLWAAAVCLGPHSPWLGFLNFFLMHTGQQNQTLTDSAFYLYYICDICLLIRFSFGCNLHTEDLLNAIITCRHNITLWLRALSIANMPSILWRNCHLIGCYR